MKKEKVEKPLDAKGMDSQTKTKEFVLSEVELLKIENIDLKMQKANQMFVEQFEAVIGEFCKRVGQKKENIILTSEGKIFISPKGTLLFKEV